MRVREGEGQTGQGIAGEDERLDHITRREGCDLDFGQNHIEFDFDMGGYVDSNAINIKPLEKDRQLHHLDRGSRLHSTRKMPYTE